MTRANHDANSGAVKLRRSALDRLVRYYLALRDRGALSEADVVPSGQIAEQADVDETQVRRDLAAIGVRGTPHVGYRRRDVVDAISDGIGLQCTHRAVIVGAGRLGGAIAEYADFKTYGLSIVAIFDVDPGKIGRSLGGCTVRHVDALETLVRREHADLAILTCPADVVQALVERLVGSGVRALWNFAPTAVTAPDGVAVRNEYISVGLAQLTYFLKAQRENGA